MTIFNSIRGICGLTLSSGLSGYALWKLYRDLNPVQENERLPMSHQERAILAIKVNKLCLTRLGNFDSRIGHLEVSFYAPYGVLEDEQISYRDLGGFSIQRTSFSDGIPLFLTSEINADPLISPIIRSCAYRSGDIRNSFLADEQKWHQAIREWEVKERMEGDLGHVNRIELPSLSAEDEQKVAYYTEVVLIAFGKGLSMPELYQVGPNPFFGRIQENGGIAFDEQGDLMTPLGKIHHVPCDGCDGSERSFLKDVRTEFDKDQRITLLVQDTKGRKLPHARHIPALECQLCDYDTFHNEWKRIRDHVFLNVNNEIKSKSRFS